MIDVINLSKRYKSVLALDNVSFKLGNGVYALLGPNGAGKSTLMNILALNVERDYGTILYDGREILDMQSEYKKILGYMPQQQSVYENFTGAEFLSYFAALKGIEKRKTREEVEKVAGYVDLENRLNDKLKGYSGGMKQRLLLANAMLGDPKVLILDEPTAGFDPKERIRTKELIRSMASDKIVVIATHIVPDVEEIANGVILMKKGKIVSCGSVSDLIAISENANSLEDVYMSVFTEEEDFL